ncbi:RluA family pseudouridine synthase [Clostridia bacterium OttesenSCG-928-F22]|nr:RluA family pseudouridine synthase [Clostridia bacterium OttesenSCG-928-F22]
MNILYEDNHILVVEKPVNMPVQQDESGSPDLLSALKSYIKQKYNKPGNVFLGLVHRLDRPVGGVMVFARTSKAAARLSAQFAQNTAGKQYYAIVRGDAAEKEALEDYMKKGAGNISAIVAPDAPGAKRAKLEYTRLAFKEGLSLLDVTLHTGRSHQIRVQLAGRGLPIWGDMRYGQNVNQKGQQIALFAYSLCFTHPTLQQEMRFSLPPITAYPWTLFF